MARMRVPAISTDENKQRVRCHQAAEGAKASPNAAQAARLPVLGC